MDPKIHRDYPHNRVTQISSSQISALLAVQRKSPGFFATYILNSVACAGRFWLLYCHNACAHARRSFSRHNFFSCSLRPQAALPNPSKIVDATRARSEADILLWKHSLVVAFLPVFGVIFCKKSVSRSDIPISIGWRSVSIGWRLGCPIDITIDQSRTFCAG